jgi:hypothetical protein
MVFVQSLGLSPNYIVEEEEEEEGRVLRGDRRETLKSDTGMMLVKVHWRPQQPATLFRGVKDTNIVGLSC